MKKVPLIVFLIVLGCQSTPKKEAINKIDTKEQLQNDIRTMNDSLMSIYNLSQEVLRSYGKEDIIKYKTDRSLIRIELINRNLAYYKAFPEDSLSAYCLADVQQLYDDAGVYQRAIDYGDSIALLYPDFKDLLLVLEKNAAILDINMENRDTMLIRNAYERLLAYPELPTDLRDTYNARLSNLHIDFIQFLQK
jgi:hypothetical protein